jgi:RNA polymerase sigma-B factor
MSTHEPIMTRLRSQPVRAALSAGGDRPGDMSGTTEELLRDRDHLPADHPDRAKLRARAIELNLLLASRLARRYAGRGEPLDDLSQVAALALVKAVDSFDTGRQIPFAGFAVPSIVGALKKHFRDTTWAMRTPRPMQELGRRVHAATDELSQQLGRQPTTIDLANHLQTTADEVLTAIRAWQSYRLPSLNQRNDGNGDVDVIDLIGGIDPRYARADDHVSLQPLLATLPPRERRIITLRFYHHMNQTQIGAEIGASQMHVSRLLRKSLARLRAAMPR